MQFDNPEELCELIIQDIFNPEEEYYYRVMDYKASSKASKSRMSQSQSAKMPIGDSDS